MARPNQFDQKIKSKVYSHKAEPSARVWAGVREAIPARNSGRKIIFLRLSAALILLSLAGGAWWYFGTDQGTIQGGKQLTEQLNQPQTPQSAWAGSTSQPSTSDASPVTVDTQEADPKEIFREETPAWNAPTAKVSNSKPSRKAIANDNATQTTNPAQENLSAPIVEPALESRNEVDETPALAVPVEEEVIEAPAPLPTLQEVIAEEEKQVKEGTLEKAKEVQAESNQSRKRRIDLNNLDFQKVKAQTGSALGNLAQATGEKIGIHTEVDESDKKKKFSANFGPFKIKRVKNKRN